MLKYRAISFPLLLLLAAAVVFWKEGGPWIFAVLAVPVTVMALLETAAIGEKLALPSFRIVAVLCGLALLLLAGMPEMLPKKSFDLLGTFSRKPYGECALWAFMPVLAALLLFARDRVKAARKLLGTAGVTAFALAPVLALCRIYFAGGALLFLALVLTTKAADTGGYIVGMLSGKFLPGGNHKIVPSVSPKKSWEGTLGGLLFSLIAAVLFRYFDVLAWNWGGVLLFGALAFLGSFAGDLTESQLKRAAGIKDSGSWIPGMGGVLDVLDSFIYNAPLFYAATLIL